MVIVLKCIEDWICECLSVSSVEQNFGGQPGS